ncbi:MAG: hypothetical protein ABIP64_11190, partial [Burkholderiales bacterium]
KNEVGQDAKREHTISMSRTLALADLVRTYHNMTTWQPHGIYVAIQEGGLTCLSLDRFHQGTTSTKLLHL